MQRVTKQVRLACTNHLIPLKGFVNGVLRNVVRFHEDTPYPKAKENLVRHLSVWYSMPEWIVTRFMEQYGPQQTEAILRSFLDEERGISLRCNLSRASKEDIVASLRKQGVTVEEGRLFPNALRIRDYGRLNELEAFEKGWVQVQDESSLIVGEAAPVNERQRCDRRLCRTGWKINPHCRQDAWGRTDPCVRSHQGKGYTDPSESDPDRFS